MFDLKEHKEVEKAYHVSDHKDVKTLGGCSVCEDCKMVLDKSDKCEEWFNALREKVSSFQQYVGK